MCAKKLKTKVMKTNYLIALFLIANLFDDGISIVYNSSLNPTVETSNKPESDLDDDPNDGGTTIYKQDVELTENDIKNCRLTFHSNDNCPAGRV